MANKEQIKELVVQTANLAVAEMAKPENQHLTGEEKEHKVCEFVAGIVKNLLSPVCPPVAWIPQELIANFLDYEVDEVQEVISEIDVKSFVKKQYNRIKHLFKK